MVAFRIARGDFRLFRVDPPLFGLETNSSAENLTRPKATVLIEKGSPNHEFVGNFHAEKSGHPPPSVWIGHAAGWRAAKTDLNEEFPDFPAFRSLGAANKVRGDCVKPQVSRISTSSESRLN